MKSMQETNLKQEFSGSLFSKEDIYLFKEGSHFRLYEKLGSHEVSFRSQAGTYFAVWAPNAGYVSVIGDFNGWDKKANPLACRQDSSGIWETFVPLAATGQSYKYFIVSKHNNHQTDKSDPFSFFNEASPKTASRIWDISYQWKDRAWMEKRKSLNGLKSPISIYELHIGSWKRAVEEGSRFLNYREFAQALLEYLLDTGYTHVEFLPVMEHPFYGSWGYQVLGFFAPTSRYGTPQDFMYLIDLLHQNNIGVILDWVPSHFPSDGHGLVYFDGTHLYEHSDLKKGFHPDWKSYIFNYGRNEVQDFLISSAFFWLDKYHIDALRVDGVASMLYLDYSRKDGEWIANKYGGNENLEAIAFLKRFNQEVYATFEGVETIAEESTAWPSVSRPVYLGGLGFGFKWNMGWMHDTLDYISKDPIHRKYQHNELTFSMLYAFHENFILSLSHDEVVYGKGSLLSKMPGDDWQKFANLRLLFGYMFAHPGKKLMFMGQEFGQWSEWSHDTSLDWHLLNHSRHKKLQSWIKDLNLFYRSQPSLYELDFQANGFEWIDCNDWQNSILVFLRKAESRNEELLIACNFTPVVRYSYKVGVPVSGVWQEVLNSDSEAYGGSNLGNKGSISALRIKSHGRDFSLSLLLPPLSVVIFKKPSCLKDNNK